MKAYEYHFARIPYSVFNALDRGDITRLMFEILVQLHKQADWNTGVVRSVSAEFILRRLGDDEDLPSERTIRRHMQGLVEAGWLLSDYRKGQKRPYSVTLTNFVPKRSDRDGDRDGDTEQIGLNPREIKPWRETSIYRGVDGDRDRNQVVTESCPSRDRVVAANNQVLSDSSQILARDSSQELIVDDDGGAPKSKPAGQDKTSGNGNHQGVSVMSDDEIYREYQAVFHRVNRDERLDLEFQMPTATHRKEAAGLYRTLGRDGALAQWEHFLSHDDHDTTQRAYEFNERCEPTGKTVSETVQRTWLLHDFVVKYGTTVGTT